MKGQLLNTFSYHILKFSLLGDVGSSLYFILSGGVTVEVSEKDEKTGHLKTQVSYGR